MPALLDRISIHQIYKGQPWRVTLARDFFRLEEDKRKWHSGDYKRKYNLFCITDPIIERQTIRENDRICYVFKKKTMRIRASSSLQLNKTNIISIILHSLVKIIISISWRTIIITSYWLNYHNNIIKYKYTTTNLSYNVPLYFTHTFMNQLDVITVIIFC